MLPIESSDYELLLVVYSNFRRFTDRFRDTSCFNDENYIFAYDTCIWPFIWRSWILNLEMKFGARNYNQRCATAYTMTATKMTATNHVGHKPWPWRPQKWKITLNVQFTSFNIVAYISPRSSLWIVAVMVCDRQGRTPYAIRWRHHDRTSKHVGTVHELNSQMDRPTDEQKYND